MSPADDRSTEKPAPHVTVLEGPDPSGVYSAGVLRLPLSLAVGSHKAGSREGALEALRARLAELGRPAELSVFASLEAAREEESLKNPPPGPTWDFARIRRLFSEPSPAGPELATVAAGINTNKLGGPRP